MADMDMVEEELQVSEPEMSLPPLGLEDLSAGMQDACARAGWSRLMPVQAHSMPYLLARRDIMVQSRTGSGKTGAYLLPMLELLDASEGCVQALVLAPTRELAVQVEREASTIFDGTGLRAAALYGGTGYGKQLDALRSGVHFIVGTPGRILDHLMRRSLDLRHLRVLVFDEADRMLSIGFYPDMKAIQRYLPGNLMLSTLFSATYPQHVLNLAGEFLRDPQMLSLSQGQVHVAAIRHLFVECGRMDKDRTLVRLLETENPASAIIFCNTKSNVHYVTGVLQGFGYDADELSADLSQNRREAVLDKLRAGKVRLLVATDVAARGIDIPDLSHVFLYEPPEDRESYIHRSGRTGRAGAAGTVISLVDIMEKMELNRIASFYRIDLEPLPNPTDGDVAKAVGEREMARLDVLRRACTGLQLERARRYLQLARELALSEDEDQQMLLALLLDADFQTSLGLERTLPRPRIPHDDGAARRGRKHERHGARDAGPFETGDESAPSDGRFPEAEGSGKRHRHGRGGCREAVDNGTARLDGQEGGGVSPDAGDGSGGGDASAERRPKRRHRSRRRGAGNGQASEGGGEKQPSIEGADGQPEVE